MSRCADVFISHDLAPHRRVVVRRTFIEVQGDADEDETPTSGLGLGRRCCSDSALCEMMALAGGCGAAFVAKAAGATSFELHGLSDTETCSEGAAAGQAQDDSEGSVSSGGRHVGSATPSDFGGVGSATPSDFGGDALPEHHASAAPFAKPPAAPTTADLERLLSENARLSRENELLRERAQLILGAAPAAPQGAARAGQPSDATARQGQNGLDEAERSMPPAERTTLMLRNVPNNYSRTTLVAMLDEEGFSGLYDFVYLPMDFNSGACLGYAFVNLVNAQVVPAFWQAFDGYARWVVPSRKVCRVGWSGPHQGLAAHVERYRNSPVMHPSVPDEYRPLLLANGWRVAFPGPSKATRAPRVRHRGDAAPQRQGRGGGRRR